ncbi:hypothetical protein [Streptomyces sp. NPDC052042]|uniref:hypothetical protein n=1 Tax=Streptomyces sp. NPDC052042 TaxID=3365683 RepID=UPI0037D4B071
MPAKDNGGERPANRHSIHAELRCQAMEFNLAPTATHTGLRTRLGWFLVESGLRILPRHPGRPGRGSALPSTT